MSLPDEFRVLSEILNLIEKIDCYAPETQNLASTICRINILHAMMREKPLLSSVIVPSFKVFLREARFASQPELKSALERAPY